ncbi:IS3 family transposase [Halomonas sp. YLB-10]|uniref:IS3 family transposase n=1 Tax=Halomonas sp. YLB-10 TaxID=2483111 RepID=UPI00390894E6
MQKPLTERAIEDQRFLGLIRNYYAASSSVYGYSQLYAGLEEAGENCGKHRASRIMR